MHKLLTIFLLTQYFLFVKNDELVDEVCNLVNEWRVQNGLSEVKINRLMQTIAHDHVFNLIENHNFDQNMHTWYVSDKLKEGVNPCVYRGNEDFNCMANKGREYTEGAYSGMTFENIGYSFRPSPTQFVDEWKNSPGHNALLLLNQAKVCGSYLEYRYGALWIGTSDYDVSPSSSPPPTSQPSAKPTSSPTLNPTLNPTLSPISEAPTLSPTLNPTPSTTSPTQQPTTSPISEAPTLSPTPQPTQQPERSEHEKTKIIFLVLVSIILLFYFLLTFAGIIMHKRTSL